MKNQQFNKRLFNIAEAMVYTGMGDESLNKNLRRVGRGFIRTGQEGTKRLYDIQDLDFMIDTIKKENIVEY